MLAMTLVNHIKNLRNLEDASINEITKRVNVNWRTAKKYADTDQVPKEKHIERKGMMYWFPQIGTLNYRAMKYIGLVAMS